MNATLTLERFAEELVSYRATNVGDAARTMARDCLADAVACAAVGITTSAYQRSGIAVRQVLGGGPPNATVWFAAEPRSLLQAAYLNSVAVSAHDLDDGNREATGHPGEAVIPAVIAEAEAAGADDVDLLDAIVVGYEAGLRIAAARTTSSVPTLATGRWAGFAAAAASCRLAGDDAATTAAALAHAGSLAPQLIAPDPQRVDGLKEATPWGVTAGLMAARLARAAVPAPTYLLESHPDYRPEALASVRFGTRPAILDTYFKRYACCRWIHPAIDALTALHTTERFALEEIERIDIATFRRGTTLSNSPHPRTLEEAHYSFPFCAALCLSYGPDSLLPIDPAVLGDPRVLALADKVHVYPDATLEAAFPARTPAVVRIHARDGVREMAMTTAQGDPSLPFLPGVLRQKHRKLLATLPTGAGLAAEDALYRSNTGVELTRLTDALRSTGQELT